MKTEPDNVLRIDIENPPREATNRLVWILGALYRLAVAGGAGVLVWHGGSAWILVAVAPLMLFAPKPNA